MDGQTIDITPDAAGLRRFALHVAQSDLPWAVAYGADFGLTWDDLRPIAAAAVAWRDADCPLCHGAGRVVLHRRHPEGGGGSNVRHACPNCGGAA